MTRETLNGSTTLSTLQVLSAREAALLLRMHRDRLIRKIRAGEVKGYMDAGRYVVPIQSIEEYQNTRRAALGEDSERMRLKGEMMFRSRSKKAA